MQKHLPRWLIIALVAFVTVKAIVSPTKHSVYPAYTEAARDFWSGEPTGFVSQQYLPFFSIALTPFAALPDPAGCALWAALGHAVYLTALRAFHHTFLPDRSWTAFLTIGLLVGLSSLVNQQANVPIIGGLLWGVVLVRRRQWWLAAVCLALPAFKLYPLALGLVLGVLYPRQLLGRLLLVFAGLLLLPFAVLPPAEAWERYVWIAEYAGGGTHSQHFKLMGVHELLEQFGTNLSTREFFPVQALSGGLIPLLLVLQQFSSSQGWEGEVGREGEAPAEPPGTAAKEHPLRERGSFGSAGASPSCPASPSPETPPRDGQLLVRALVLTSLWFVTFGPSVEAPTYLLAAPAFACLLLDAHTRRAWVAVGFLAGVIFLCGPAQTSLLGRDVQQWLVQARPSLLALLLVFAWQFIQSSPPLPARRAGVSVTPAAAR